MRRNNTRGAGANENGYSLVELLVSLGLMTGVMVAIASMFVMGGTYVKAGKQLTVATALSQDIMEDINKQSYSGLYLFVQGSSPDPNATSTVTDSRTPASVADATWGADIRSQLHKGYVVITATPIGGTLSTPTFASGEGVRIGIELGWTELRRDRTVKMEMVRF